jgi:pimeloyl-ACP methyl ester carboxylesterase
MPFIQLSKQRSFLKMIVSIYYYCECGFASKSGQRRPAAIDVPTNRSMVNIYFIFKQLERDGKLYFSFLKITCLLLLIISGFGCRNNQQPVAYGKNMEAGKYADVNGIKMYYEIYGQGEPLVLLHGNGGSINAGRQQIAFFSKNYKVIAVDSRGQGNTNDNSDSLSYDAMAADLNGLLNQLKIDSAYIIGQSDGAIIGLITAFRYPKKVKMLAAMAPNIRPDSAVLYTTVAEQGAKELAKYEDSLKAGFKEVMRKVKLLRLMQYHPHISTSELGAIKSPVMVMCGDRDVVRLSHIIEIFRAIPKSNLCVLPGSTHFALRKNPDVFNETIYHFFTKPFSMPDSY